MSDDLIDLDVSDNTVKLTNAIKDLPQLLEKKRIIDSHTSIATGNLFFYKISMVIKYFF